MRNNDGVCEIITLLIANKISSSEAGEWLRRSDCQVRRIRQRYEARGWRLWCMATKVDPLRGVLAIAIQETSSSKPDVIQSQARNRL